MLKGQIYEELGKLDDAVRAFRSALELDAQAEGPLDALIRLMVIQGKPRRPCTTCGVMP